MASERCGYCGGNLIDVPVLDDQRQVSVARECLLCSRPARPSSEWTFGSRSEADLAAAWTRAAHAVLTEAS